MGLAPVRYRKTDGQPYGTPHLKRPAGRPKKDAVWPPPPQREATPREVAYARELLAELARRRCESVKIYEPTPVQAAFHESKCKQRIIVGSNRSGKSSAAIMELALAVTGQHPDRDRYPQRDGRAIVVMKDMEKIGEVFWRKIGRAGCFLMVKDPYTRTWRTFRGEPDRQLGLQPRQAPPLIPPRMIDSISWESRKSSIPKKIRLRNGWEISCYSSNADPYTIQGVDVDIVYFDEEITHRSWYPEAVARLVDRDGRFWWAATPQTGTQQLFDLHCKAEAQASDNDPNPTVSEFFMSIYDNPYLSKKAIDDFVSAIDDDERRVRVDGEFAIQGTRVFEGRFFPRGVHGVDPFPVPATWSHFCAIDPGHQVCAVLFGAIPPAKPDASDVPHEFYGDFIYLYDELYIKNCDAKMFASRFAQATHNRDFVSYLFDYRGGHLTEIGSGLSPERQYIDALKRAKVKHFVAGGRFTYGATDVAAGILKIKELLAIRDDGTPRLRVLRGRCPKLCWEMERYSWKVSPTGEILDTPVMRHNHLCDCLRYMCNYTKLKWHKPKKDVSVKGNAYEEFKKVRDRMKKQARPTAGVNL